MKSKWIDVFVRVYTSNVCMGKRDNVTHQNFAFLFLKKSSILKVNMMLERMWEGSNDEDNACNQQTCVVFKANTQTIHVNSNIMQSVLIRFCLALFSLFIIQLEITIGSVQRNVCNFIVSRLSVLVFLSSLFVL